jgi:hypothetical protein
VKNGVRVDGIRADESFGRSGPFSASVQKEAVATDSTVNWLIEQHTGILYNGNYGPYYVSYCA